MSTPPELPLEASATPGTASSTEPLRRARSAGAKASRRDAVLDAALALAEERPGDDVTMAAVAERAGIAKGTLFLYFPAKDVLSLALIERLLGDWLDALDARLGAPRPPTAPGELAEAVAESLGARHLLPLLLGRLAQVRDAAPEHAAAVQQAIGARLDRTGALVESRLSFMKRGDGRRFAGFVLTQLAGLQHVSGTLTGDAEAGIEPHASLRRTVRLYLRGLKAKRAD